MMAGKTQPKPHKMKPITFYILHLWVCFFSSKLVYLPGTGCLCFLKPGLPPGTKRHWSVARKVRTNSSTDGGWVISGGCTVRSYHTNYSDGIGKGIWLMTSARFSGHAAVWETDLTPPRSWEYPHTCVEFTIQLRHVHIGRPTFVRQF